MSKHPAFDVLGDMSIQVAYGPEVTSLSSVRTALPKRPSTYKAMSNVLWPNSAGDVDSVANSPNRFRFKGSAPAKPIKPSVSLG